MTKPAMPPQITRLLMLTVAIVAVYFTARHFLVPKSYGVYGPYRADSLKEIAALPVSYAGRAACSECHADENEMLAKGPHKTVSCESCHGAAQGHVDDLTGAKPVIDDPGFCLRCHEANPARPPKFPQIDPADHYTDAKCAECHVPHNPAEAPVKNEPKKK